jgi:hypothetical protein
MRLEHWLKTLALVAIVLAIVFAGTSVFAVALRSWTNSWPFNPYHGGEERLSTCGAPVRGDATLTHPDRPVRLCAAKSSLVLVPKLGDPRLDLLASVAVGGGEVALELAPPCEDGLDGLA